MARAQTRPLILRQLRRAVHARLGGPRQRQRPALPSVLSQSCFLESFGICKLLNFESRFSDFTPKIEIWDQPSKEVKTRYIPVD